MEQDTLKALPSTESIFVVCGPEDQRFNLNTVGLRRAVLGQPQERDDLLYT